mgnify:FL=1
MAIQAPRAVVRRIRLSTCLPLALTSVAAAACAGFVAAQESDETRRIGYRETVAVQWVGVPVELPPLVAQEQLPAEAFALTVDGRPVPIHDFEGPARELALIVLQDLSGSMGLGSKIDQSRAIFEALLAQLGEQDEVSVVAVSLRTTEVRVPLAVPDRRHHDDPGAWSGWGKTAVLDALMHAPRLARESRRARTGIVLITDGDDNASLVQEEQLAAVLQASAVPIYLFDLSRPRASLLDEPESGAAPAPETVADIDTLVELARATGGATYRLGAHLDPATAARSLVRRLANQYWITFPADSQTPTTAHSIRVALRPDHAPRRVRRALAAGGGDLRHRSHYLGGEPLIEP